MTFKLRLSGLAIITFVSITGSVVGDENTESAVPVTRKTVRTLLQQYVELQQQFEDARSRAKFRKAGMGAMDSLSPRDFETWTRGFADNGDDRQSQALACMLLGKAKAGFVRMAQLLSNPQFKQQIEKGSGRQPSSSTMKASSVEKI